MFVTAIKKLVESVCLMKEKTSEAKPETAKPTST